MREWWKVVDRVMVLLWIQAQRKSERADIELNYCHTQS